ncbi:precorrin-3B C(17)-methyltransferase [Tritonibacter mobilis]|uniref:precorrin-3B C(17)-methyltransferase n=1 Tax=Tritonibacter mobilis TaxID=379347 RepID=UPI0014039739|nr:precorrin-3B C(17)-methyltransferase [Tritonibacter mobilis]NHM19461.1 precorrin-3B C(17)-methyltransferase [Tritonibacter mobilis]NHM23611.1 precorrin-3B C(17)-methyltransferase [Tritonibacter mobilis]
MRDAQKGWVAIAGLGPGDERMVIPEVQEVLAEATDVVGYIPYVARIAPRAGLTLHASDNRVEVDRATQALQMAAEGKRVVVVSSGDPGVFAMASAVFEALEDGSKAQPAWLDLDIRVLPGITAMLAAAAAIGAPLGHDFAAINLSDNLKPWELIEHRLQLVGEAGLAMAFYNPRSKSRPHQFARALDVLRAACGADTLITFARDVTKPGQEILTVPLKDARPEMADMRTVVIVGNRDTRRVGPYVYTPRFAPGHQPGHQTGQPPTDKDT